MSSQYRPYHSEGALYVPKSQQVDKDRIFDGSYLHETKSDPCLSPRKSHPLLNYSDDFKPITYGELILAAETLENIVNEGTFIGTIRSKFKTSTSSREMSNRVLKLVYGTMKCLQF
jgi:hypothetical protein